MPIFGSVFFFTILLFKENLSELQPCLRNAGNSVSECSILKITLGEHASKELAPCSAKKCLVLSQICPLLYKAIENPALGPHWRFVLNLLFVTT